MCPVEIFIHKRRDNVKGRINFETTSIIEIKKPKSKGVPSGVKWAKNFLNFKFKEEIKPLNQSKIENLMTSGKKVVKPNVQG